MGESRRLTEEHSSQVMEFELRFFKDGEHPELMSVPEAAGSIKDALLNHSILLGLQDSLSAAGGLEAVQISLSSMAKPTEITHSASDSETSTSNKAREASDEMSTTRCKT